MSFATELLASDKKGLFRSDDNTVMYPTGFAALDYANGYWQSVYKNGKIEYYPMLGITGGTFISVIGTTGTGKTTWADQAGYNIIKPFEDGLLIHCDAEKTTTRERIVSICGAEYDDPRIRLNKTHTSIEATLSQIDMICKMKEANSKRFMYEPDIPSYSGKKFKAYVPTVFIIDSLPAFNSESFNTEDLGNADQMRAAKDITRFYTNVLDRAWQYNIITIVINHIRPKTTLDPYAPPPKGLIMLGPNEMLPRGQVAQYSSQTYFRINVNKSDAYKLEDDGFTGYRATFQLAKSKTNTIGTSFPICFTHDHGFDPIFSHYEYAKAVNLLDGRNPFIYFKGLDQYKFSRKTFVQRWKLDEVFRTKAMEILRPMYETLLGPKDATNPEISDVVGDIDLTEDMALGDMLDIA